jgi:ABC-2 type transport system permease protein
MRPGDRIRFSTVFKREFIRYWHIKRQTILTPLLNTYLYIGIFGAALGSRIQTLEGHPYVVFIIPGLLMMAFAMAAFENNCSSVYQQRFSRVIDDQLASPLTNLELIAGYALGGFVRGLIVASLTFVTASLLVDLPVVHPFLLIASFAVIGSFFSLLGVLMGVIAESFDNISLYQSFILQPLIFLGGVFYSVHLLPPLAQLISHFNPIFYMINTIRFGFLGQSDINPYLSLSLVTVATVGVFLIVYEIFRRGYKLRL